MKNGLYILGITGLLFFSAACNNNTSRRTTTAGVQKEVWTCSMHPEIVRDKPGTCPICGMDLIKKVEHAKTPEGIKLDVLLQPTDRFVVSSIALTSPVMRSVRPEIEALGTIHFDTREINNISAWVSGRIEKLYVRYRYQYVKKGQRIMDIYSPALLTSQQDLLFLIAHDPDNISLLNAAKQRLYLLGMNEGQVQQVILSKKPSYTVSIYSNYSGLIQEANNTMQGQDDGSVKINFSTTEELSMKEGMYVQKGQIIFQLFNIDKSWALLSIFPESQNLVKRGNNVNIIPEADPQKEIHAKIDFIEPFFRTQNKTLAARVYFDNTRRRLPIGSQVRAAVFSDEITANWLPSDAVLSLGMGKVVFIKTPGGFTPHQVETGFQYGHLIQILSGLSLTDSVAANAQYLMDSEGFIKENSQP